MRAIEGQLEVLLRELDVAVAARDVPAARALLAAGEDCLGLLDRDAGMLSLEARRARAGPRLRGPACRAPGATGGRGRQEARHIRAPLFSSGTPSRARPQVEEFPSWRHAIESALALRKTALAASLERQLSDAHATGPEIRWGRGGGWLHCLLSLRAGVRSGLLLGRRAQRPPTRPAARARRSVARALGQLLGDCHAAAATLHCYSRKIAAAQAGLLRQLAAGAAARARGCAGSATRVSVFVLHTCTRAPANQHTPSHTHTTGGSDPGNLEYAGALAQRTLLEVARAADDIVAIFGAKQARAGRTSAPATSRGPLCCETA